MFVFAFAVQCLNLFIVMEYIQFLPLVFVLSPYAHIPGSLPKEIFHVSLRLEFDSLTKFFIVL